MVTGQSARLWGLVWALSLAATAAAEDRPNLVGLVSRYGEPVVGPESAPVNDLKVSAGHLSLVLSGRAAPVRAGEDVVGFFFRGKGSLAVRPDRLIRDD